jgi:hypothetical protein
LVGLLLLASVAQADPPPLEEGVEVLARGPVHDAYAEPVSAAPSATPIINREPPPLVEEIPAEQKPEGEVQWIPGYWAWDDDRQDFLWVSGIWRLPPPGREWVAGYWAQVDGGWQWVPGFWAESGVQELAYYPAPPDPVDAGPSEPAPTPDSTFVPGNWVYRETRYVWRPGFWSVYRPGQVWIPAHYVWTPAGYLYVEGYWDYPLRERGLLFAPVAIDLRLALRPHWFFRPRYVVEDDCLLGAFFVNSDCDQYYFGDYFDDVYRPRGFISWLAFRFGHGCYDPLFSYYRFNYGVDSGWEVGLQDLYAGRFSGALARPPRTLIEQNTVVQNITNNTVINNVTNIRNVTMLTPLSQVDPAVTPLRAVTPPVQQTALAAAQHFRTVGGQRGNLESQLLASGTAPVRTTAAPQVVKVNLPTRSTGAVSTSGTKPQAVSTRVPATQNSLAATSRGKPVATPQAVSKPVTTPTAVSKPMAKPPAAVKPAVQNRGTVTSTRKPAPNSQTIPKPAVQTHAAAPSVLKPATKPQAAPKPVATPKAPSKPVIQNRVTAPSATRPTTTRQGAVKPMAKPQAVSRPVSKPQATPKPVAKAPAAVKPALPQRVAAPSTPKPAAKPQAVSKPLAKPQMVSRPVTKPQAAPRSVAKAPTAPARPTPKPQAAPARPAVRAPSPPAPRPQPAASRNTASTRPAPKPAPAPSNPKDRHH